ncbi:hypothetical protein ABEF95_001433 [Exophiala dermatitidis]
MAGVSSYPPYRTATPMSSSLHHARGIWNNSAGSFRGLPKSPTESTTPHYYDYSESFWEGDDIRQPAELSAVSLVINEDVTAPENEGIPDRRQAQSPFGIMQGSTFQPAELPTRHNRRSSEQSKYSYAGVIPRRVSSLAATTTPARSNSATSKAIYPAVLPYQENPSRASRNDKDNARTSTASRRTCGSTHSSAFFPNASRSPRDLTSLAARVHSPSSDRRPHDRSISQLLEYDYQQERRSQDSAGVEAGLIDPRWKLPSFTFRPLSLVSGSSGTRARPKTSGDVPPKDTLEILSPMPQRPMSSQSQKRFSRILELQDNYPVDQTVPLFKGQTPAKLNPVEEQPGIQELGDLAARSPVDDRLAIDGGHGAVPEDKVLVNTVCSDANFRDSYNTFHDKSTVESLLDRHIECLGLYDDGISRFEGRSDSGLSEVVDYSSAESTVKISTIVKELHTQPRQRPATSSSYRHSSLASTERRKLMPRRLFASMDSRMSPKPNRDNPRELSRANFSSVSMTECQLSSGWQTLPSASELPSIRTKVSLTSGDMADIDTDPPTGRFKIRRVSELAASTSESSKVIPDAEVSQASQPYSMHRRSRSDVVTMQASQQRRRMRIMLKAKRKSTSLGQLADGNHGEQQMQNVGHEDDWVTEESRRDGSTMSPVAGYAELSGESVLVHAPTIVLSTSLPAFDSVPRRWTSMLAAMPQPVKRGIDIVRKASVRTVRSHRSNVSVIEPLNSTRMSSQTPRLGPVPQLAPPEFGPPLTSSDINLSLHFPDPPQVFRPPLRQVQSFFSDDSSAQTSRVHARKRFDLHSLRSGLTRSSGVLGAKHNGGQHINGLKLSHSCQMKGQSSFEYSRSPLGDSMPMGESAAKNKKVIDRFKDWWKRQCMQKTLSMMKKKNGRNVRNGALV